MRPFEDYCWRDLLTPDMERIFSAYQRDRTVSLRPALVVVYPSADFVATFQPGWLDATAGLIELARRERLPVIHSSPKNSAAAQVLRPNEDETVCVRSCDSAFLFTDLEATLTRMRCDGVIVCGAPTSGAVRVTAVEAKSYGYKAVVAEEATGDEAAMLHKVALFDIAHKYADVMSVDELRSLIAELKVRGVS